MNAKIKCFLRQVDCTGIEPVFTTYVAILAHLANSQTIFVKCKYPMLGVMPYVIRAARITHECKIQN